MIAQAMLRALLLTVAAREHAKHPTATVFVTGYQPRAEEVVVGVVAIFGKDPIPDTPYTWVIYKPEGRRP